MSVIFQLKDKSRSTSSILIVVCFRGQYYKKPTGETTPPKYWNQKSRRCRVTREFHEGEDKNSILARWDIAAQKTIAHFKTHINVPSPTEFWDYFDSVYYEDTSRQNIYLTDFLNAYIEEIKDARAVNTIKKYRTTLNKLVSYEAHRRNKIKFEDVDITFYNSFQSWIYNQKYSANYFGALIKTVKIVVREAHYRGLCSGIKGISHRDFVAVSEDVDTIYLTSDELSLIFNMEITPEAFRREFNEKYPDIKDSGLNDKLQSFKLLRQRFLIGAYSGLRVSDFSRLSAHNFGKKTISIKTVKTGAQIVVPIHPNIRAILNEGFDPEIRMSDQKMNKHLKELARLAGIKDRVVINENVAGKNVERVYFKYELVCTHTARRSFATNALKSGVPLVAISKILGHSTIATTEKYLRMSAEENAEALMDHAFFKG